ncbi:MAG: hypothetical protein ACRDNM_16355, partial [Gaiellaceae bacterium]
MPARVRERTEQALRIRVLGRRATVLHLARRTREAPRPPRKNLVGSVGLAVGDRAQQHANAGEPLLLPRRRLRHERDEVVEVGALDAHRHAVLERHQPQAPVRVLGRARCEELLERALARTALRQLLHERRAFVEADLAAGDRRPVALLVVVEEARVDALPLAEDD